MSFKRHMDAALDQARAAAVRSEVPVGAVIVSPEGKVVASAGNQTQQLNDPTAHAEILAIRSACAAFGSQRLPDHDLYVTLEPCPMCASAISQARIRRLYYGASDPKSGGIENGPQVFTHPQSHHLPEVYGGIGADISEKMLKDFFVARRT